MKRFLNAVIAFMLFVSLSAPASFAQATSEDINDMIQAANDKIYACVAEAQEQAEGVEPAKVDKIIFKLVEETDKIAQKTVEEAAKEGYTVELEYITVYIGGKAVVIDPMTVH